MYGAGKEQPDDTSAAASSHPVPAPSLFFLLHLHHPCQARWSHYSHHSEGALDLAALLMTLFFFFRKMKNYMTAQWIPAHMLVYQMTIGYGKIKNPSVKTVLCGPFTRPFRTASVRQ